MAHRPRPGSEPVYAGPDAALAPALRTHQRPQETVRPPGAKVSDPGCPGFSRALRQATRDASSEPMCAGIFAASGRPSSDLLIGADGTLPRRSRLELPTNFEPDDLWRTIQEELRQSLAESTYEIWIA